MLNSRHSCNFRFLSWNTSVRISEGVLYTYSI